MKTKIFTRSQLRVIEAIKTSNYKLVYNKDGKRYSLNCAKAIDQLLENKTIYKDENNIFRLF